MSVLNESENLEVSKSEPFNNEAVSIEYEAETRDSRDKRSLRRRILAVIWDSLDKPAEERKLVTKIDCWVMTYVCIAYLCKYLDQGNVTNAYVSGMQQDLKMSGNDYNLLQTMFTVGYCIGNLPSQLIMTRIRPSIWLPTMAVMWSILVMAMAGSKSVTTMYVLRFFVGMMEASAYPGFVTLLGNWYTPDELGKRSVIFICSSSAAQMFSGYLQAGLYSGMEGRLGLRAWQWLFIFDGIISIPIALVGYFAIPDSPTTTRARWLKPDDRALAIARMEQCGRAPPKGLTWGTFRDIFTSWVVYVFCILFAAELLGIRVYNYFAIYLQSTKIYSVQQVNNISTAGYGFQIATGLIWAWLSDGMRSRGRVLCMAALVAMTGCIILSVYPEHNMAAMMTGWILTFGQTGASVLIFTWLNEILSFSAEQRAAVIGIVEAFGFAMSAWVILFTYNSAEAPHFSIGYQMATMFFAIEILGTCAVGYCMMKWPPGPKA
ncbi:putative pantothenate protein [Coleophoma crateriformis]|uniref:Putative pantothenate protein n=1 Tax=Coleophoma crateriformis TaxID=565419 RepID=A0A3D8SI83_9HELO|nr:putative pantothenate protein [Coleophoma crateriformis]